MGRGAARSTGRAASDAGAGVHGAEILLPREANPGDRAGPCPGAVARRLLELQPDLRRTGDRGKPGADAWALCIAGRGTQSVSLHAITSRGSQRARVLAGGNRPGTRAN